MHLSYEWRESCKWGLIYELQQELHSIKGSTPRKLGYL